MDIKILGPGCPKCRETEKVIKEAVAEAGVNVDVEKITDIMQIAASGVFGTPAVVVDGMVKPAQAFGNTAVWTTATGIAIVHQKVYWNP